MVAVERLDHARKAEPPRRGDRRLLAVDDLGARDGQPGRVEEPVGQALVRGDVDADRRGQRGHRRPDALLVDAVAELDQRVAVEPDERDVAADRLVDQRLGGRPERLPLGEPDEALHLGREVEEDIGVVGGDEVVDQRDRHPAGLETDRLLAVFVDAVVLAGRAGRPGLAVADVGAGQVLELERDVLGDVARPRPVAQAGDEPAAAAERAGVILERRQQGDQRLGEVRQQVRGVLLEDAEVDQEADDRLARPVVRAAQDPGLEDAQGRRGPAVEAERGAATGGPPGRPSGCGCRLRHVGLLLAADPECIGSPVGRCRGRRDPRSTRGLEEWPYDDRCNDGQVRAWLAAGPFAPSEQEIKFCRRPMGFVSPMRSTAAARRWWSRHAGSAISSTTGRAPCGAISSTSSDRWRRSSATTSGGSAVRLDRDDFSLRPASADLEAIVAAAGSTLRHPRRVRRLGRRAGVRVAHPEPVSRLILLGTVCGEPVAFSPDELAEGDYRSMIRSAGEGIPPSGACSHGSSRMRPRSRRWFDDLRGCRRRRPTCRSAASRASRWISRTTCRGSRTDPRAPVDRRSIYLDNAVTVSSLIPRAPVPLTSITSCSPTTCLACSSTRWPRSWPDRRLLSAARSATERCHAAASTSCGSPPTPHERAVAAALTLSPRTVASPVDSTPSSGSVAPLPAPPPSPNTCDASSPERTPPRARLRVGRHRAPATRSRLGGGTVPRRRSLPTVAAADRKDGSERRYTTMTMTVLARPRPASGRTPRRRSRSRR